MPRGLRYADGDVSPDGSTILCVQEQPRRRAPRPSTRSCGWRPTSRASPTPSSTAPTSCRRLAGAPTGRRGRGSSGTIPTCRGTRPGSSCRDGPRGRSSRAARRASRSARRPGRRTGRCGSAVTAAGSGACTAGPPRPVSSRWPSSAWTSASRTGCSASRASRSSRAGASAFVVTDEGLQQLGVLERDGGITMLDLPHTSFESLRAAGTDLLFIGASPTAEAHVVTVAVATRRAAARRSPSCRRATSASTSAWFSSPEPLDFPTADGATAHALVYWPRNPTVEAPAGRAPAAARDDPRRADRRRPGHAAARRAVLDEPRVRRRRRQLPRLDGLRAGLPRPAAGAVGRRRRRGLRRGRPLPRRARRRRPRSAVHPRRLGRRLHGARRARLRGRVLGRDELLRRRRPRPRWRPTPTSSRAATSTV